MVHEKATLQQLAELRLAEATLLVQVGQPSGAYYLAGYAVECALKARIAAQFKENEIPDRALVNRIYTHDLSDLVRLAGLESELSAAIEDDPVLGRRWSVTKKWSEQARYIVWTEADALDMIEAIVGNEDSNGFYQWLISRS
jgi:hypothetical protein